MKSSISYCLLWVLESALFLGYMSLGVAHYDELPGKWRPHFRLFLGYMSLGVAHCFDNCLNPTSRPVSW